MIASKVRSMWLVNLTQPGIIWGQVSALAWPVRYFFLISLLFVGQPTPPWVSLFLMPGDPELCKRGAIQLSTSEHIVIASLWPWLDETETLMPSSPCCDERYLELWARIKSFSPELLLVRVFYLHNRSGARINLELSCLYLCLLMFSMRGFFSCCVWSSWM